MNAAGDRVAIGAPNDANGAISFVGKVRVYSWSGTAWTQMGVDIAGEAFNDQSGSSVSMNAAGDRVAIGAIFNASSRGQVRVYSWNGASWTQMGVDIDGEAAGDTSGRSVSMNEIGDRVAIGAHQNDGTGSNAGHVRVYSWNGTSWIKLGQDIDGEAANDFSGRSVQMNATGDRVAIGASSNANSKGHVRVYSWNGTSWIKLGQDIDGEADFDSSGWSVSMNAIGDKVAIGARNNSGTGHVRAYSLV
jgi:hypothetical protein